MYPVPFLPHVSLDGVSGNHGLREPGLDPLDFCHVISAVFPNDVPSGNAIGAEPVENGGLETWGDQGGGNYIIVENGGLENWGFLIYRKERRTVPCMATWPCLRVIIKYKPGTK